MFMTFNDKGIEARISSSNIVAALANAIGLAPPQAVLGFLFGQVHDKNMCQHRAAAGVDRNKGRSPGSRTA
jgi:hypothetical protein